MKSGLLLVLGLLAAAPMAAHAAGPTIKPGYQINLGPLLAPGVYGPGSFAYMGMTSYLDTGNTTGPDAAGQATPVSPLSPLPMACVSGCVSSSNTVASTAAGTSATQANPVQGVTGGVPIASAATVATTAPTLANGTTQTLRADAGGRLMTDGSEVPQVVQGGAAVGNPPAVPPVPVSGVDGSGLKRNILTGSDGTVQVADQRLPAPSSGTDHSANPPALLANLLTTFSVTQPGGYSIANEGAPNAQYLLCPAGTALPANTAAATVANCTIRLLLGVGANAPGQNTEPALPAFIGTIFVLASSSTQQIPARSFP